MAIDFADVLLQVVDRRASDLHLAAGAPPTLRIPDLPYTDVVSVNCSDEELFVQVSRCT